MALPKDALNRLAAAIVELQAAAGTAGLVLANPDGSAFNPVLSGDVQIGAVEIKDGTTDARVTAKVDNAAAGTPTPLSVGGKYSSTPPSYDGNDQVTQQFNSVGALIGAGLDNFYVTKVAPTAFDGATTDARGDEGGTSDPFTLFTVTGDVLVGVFGVCTTDLTGAGNISVGITGNLTLFMAAIAATSIDQNEVWMDATPAIGKSIDALSYFVVGNGVDIVEDITTDTVTAGNIYYVALWKPLTPGSSLVAAV